MLNTYSTYILNFKGVHISRERPAVSIDFNRNKFSRLTHSPKAVYWAVNFQRTTLFKDKTSTVNLTISGM